jgi:hypothetical protein
MFIGSVVGSSACGFGTVIGAGLGYAVAWFTRPRQLEGVAPRAIETIER